MDSTTDFLFRYPIINKAHLSAKPNVSVSTNNSEKNTSPSLAAKGKPTRFTGYQVRQLEREYQINQYCSRQRRYAISIQLKLEEKQVAAWFQNRRTKSKNKEQKQNKFYVHFENAHRPFQLLLHLNIGNQISPEAEDGRIDSQASNEVKCANIIPPVPVTKPKRLRASFTSFQLIELEKEYRLDNYCKRDRLIDICCKLNLKERQVKLWFQNRRIKSKKKKQKKNEMLASLDSKQRNSLQVSGISFASLPHFQPISFPTANFFPTQNNFNGQHVSHTANGQQGGCLLRFGNLNRSIVPIGTSTITRAMGELQNPGTTTSWDMVPNKNTIAKLIRIHYQLQQKYQEGYHYQHGCHYQPRSNYNQRQRRQCTNWRLHSTE